MGTWRATFESREGLDCAAKAAPKKLMIEKIVTKRMLEHRADRLIRWGNDVIRKNLNSRDVECQWIFVLLSAQLPRVGIINYENSKIQLANLDRLSTERLCVPQLSVGVRQLGRDARLSVGKPTAVRSCRGTAVHWSAASICT